MHFVTSDINKTNAVANVVAPSMENGFLNSKFGHTLKGDPEFVLHQPNVSAKTKIDSSSLRKCALAAFRVAKSSYRVALDSGAIPKAHRIFIIPRESNLFTID